MLLGGEVFLLALEELVAQELGLNVFEAQAGDGVREALAGEALFAEDSEAQPEA